MLYSVIYRAYPVKFSYICESVQGMQFISVPLVSVLISAVIPQCCNRYNFVMWFAIWCDKFYYIILFLHINFRINLSVKIWSDITLNLWIMSVVIHEPILYQFIQAFFTVVKVLKILLIKIQLVLCCVYSQVLYLFYRCYRQNIKCFLFVANM